MGKLDNILVIIPARGGSKGIPKKNSKLLNSKPLICYTIEAAREIFKDEQICVSTDDEEIIKIVEENGIKVPFVRPSILATDTANSFDVIKHAYEFYSKKKYNISTVVFLQPTSPFRTSKHIKEALNLFSTDIDMVVSVKKSKGNPYYNLFEENFKGFLKQSKEGNFDRRQDCPEVWEYNGAIYIINVNSIVRKKTMKFEKIKKYVMDEFSSLDIDTIFDMDMAECLIKNKPNSRNTFI